MTRIHIHINLLGPSHGSRSGSSDRCHYMHDLSAPSPTPTRNNRDLRGLSAVTAAKI